MREFTWLEILLLGVISMCLGAMIMMVEGCSTAYVDYSRGPLADQLLRPKPGHTGLVNSECRHDVVTHACIWDDVEYDLNDAPTRQRLRDAGFQCSVNGKQYRIASELPGLIYEHHKKSCFLVFCSDTVDEILDYIPVSDYQKLVDANTECRSIFTYGDDE